MSSQKREVVSLNTAKQFSDFVNSHKFVVVKVTADWCGPCQRIKHNIKTLLNIHEFFALFSSFQGKSEKF